MMGKTHYKLGMLYYILFSIIPVLALIPFFESRPGITFAGIITAGFGALLPDADSQHSKINRMNPIIGMANKAVEAVEDILIKVVRVMFSVGAGALIIIYSDDIILQLSKLPKVSEYAKQITYTVAVILILTGVMGKVIIRRIPVIGDIYMSFTDSIQHVSNYIKRAAMFIVYAGFGAGIIAYSINTSQDKMFYLIGSLFIAIAIFPHRSFLHSPEGLILFSIAFTYIVGKINQPYLASAFFIGYASHLYLADIFTNEGVPLSTIPIILKKVRLHKPLSQIRVYNLVYAVLDRKLVIPLMSTGTGKGGRFEFIYTIALIVLVIVLISYSGISLALL